MPPVSAPAAVPTDRLTRFSQAIGRVIPDAMSTAVGMLLLLGVGALAIGNSGTAVMDAFYRGLWMLLPFTMQMALILVLSSTLGAAPVFRQRGRPALPPPTDPGPGVRAVLSGGRVPGVSLLGARRRARPAGVDLLCPRGGEKGDRG